MPATGTGFRWTVEDSGIVKTLDSVASRWIRLATNQTCLPFSESQALRLLLSIRWSSRFNILPSRRKAVCGSDRRQLPVFFGRVVRWMIRPTSS